MASYGPSAFPFLYGPSAKRIGHENKEGKRMQIHNLPYGLSKQGLKDVNHMALLIIQGKEWNHLTF